jgi:hypothetical protein
LLFHAIGKAEKSKRKTISFVEFVVELHPVQTESVQEALQAVHAEQNAEGYACQEDETD